MTRRRVTYHPAYVRFVPPGLCAFCPTRPACAASIQRTFQVGGTRIALADIAGSILGAPLRQGHSGGSSKSGVLLGGSSTTPSARVVDALGPLGPLLPFGLVHGTRSSASLRVYRPASLEQQLRASATAYLRQRCTVDARLHRLVLPALLKQHLTDYSRTWDQMLAYVAEQAPTTELARYIRSTVPSAPPAGRAPVRLSIKFATYDWTFECAFASSAS